MVKIVIILLIGLLIFLFTCFSIEEKVGKLRKAIICSALAATISFVGSYIVETLDIVEVEKEIDAKVEQGSVIEIEDQSSQVTYGNGDLTFVDEDIA